MKFSVVTTLYYSESYLAEFYRRLKNTLVKITPNYEIIFVNDGSPDKSLEVCLSFLEKDGKIKIIDLSRNFGHHRAMMAGLSFAKGDYICLIDCDLEEEPELLEKLYDQIIKNKDLDLVFAVQSRREGNFIGRWGGKIYYKLFNFLSDYKIPPNLLSARIMTRQYLQNLSKHQDKEPYIDGLSVITGFRQGTIEARKQPYKGSTSYTFTKRLTLVFNAIISFSSRPLIYIFYLGLLISNIAFLMIIYLIIKKIIYRAILEGWVSIMVSIWFLGGLIMCSLGLVGLYLSKIFNEVKNRPSTIIKKVYEKKDS